MLPPFRLVRPTTLEGALSVLDDDHVPYWGGTELLLAMKAGLLGPATLIDLKRIPELRGIEREPDRLVIGAGMSHMEVAEDVTVAQTAPILGVVERRVGNARVRSQGTVGGNICFAEPRSDVTTILVALDAEVTLVSRTEERTVPIVDFLLGPYTTVRRPDEILTKFSIPLPAARGEYLKFQISERPTVAVAAVRLPSGAARVVVGAVNDRPIVVEGSNWSDIDPAVVVARTDPVGDLAGSVEYKRHVTEVYVRRILASMSERERLGDQ